VQADARAVEALADALEGTGKALVAASGTPAGPGGVATERDFAAVIGRHLNLPTASVPAERIGFLGMVLTLDCPASSALTTELLGWRPVRPGLIEDLDKGHYFD